MYLILKVAFPENERQKTLLHRIFFVGTFVHLASLTCLSVQGDTMISVDEHGRIAAICPFEPLPISMWIRHIWRGISNTC